MITMYEYPPCSTCRNAKKWFEARNIDIRSVHIVNERPTKEEMKRMIAASGMEVKSFFNYRGKKYRELGLKDQLPALSEDEAVELLVSDGMLIRRPLVTDGERVTIGFNEKQYEEVWG